MRKMFRKVKITKHKMGRKKSQGGYTLLEVVIAISILTVGLLGVASMQVAGMRGNAISHDVTGSSDTAQDRIEKIFSMPFTDFKDKTGDGLSGLNDEGGAADGHDLSNSGYRVYWNVAEDEPSNGVKRIRVIVKSRQRALSQPLKIDFLIIEL